MKVAKYVSVNMEVCLCSAIVFVSKTMYQSGLPSNCFYAHFQFAHKKSAETLKMKTNAWKLALICIFFCSFSGNVVKNLDSIWMET